VQITWNDNQPIYQQLRDRIITLIIEGAFSEGEAVPSVRQVASEYRINHLTVAKAYQELVAEGLLEKRRGLGMFVLQDARQKLLAQERDKLMKVDLPEMIKRGRQLGISEPDLTGLVSALYREEG